MRCMPFTLSALLWFQASSFDPREPASTETSTSTTTSTTTATTTTRTRTTRTTTTVTAETVSTSSTVITTSTSTTVTSTTTVKCCQYGDWADWTQCLVPCQGQQLRIRGVDMPQEQADRCQDRRELRSCAEQCMDCVWSEWGSWEACGPGGGGKVSRYRQSVPREGGRRQPRGEVLSSGLPLHGLELLGLRSLLRRGDAAESGDGAGGPGGKALHGALDGAQALLGSWLRCAAAPPGRLPQSGEVKGY
eukprot:CAMPEP_0181542184 /NCGR_PEP_ID=MMETSP1110-20121109/77781_1 /TAXON_ID=174948 /ORGANISM="Symbiodinium sp., Strain CCMP421" /LENGTH=247 /DNA_ID=CAMNT_0023673869 /DNA_START=46 /DNA_END=786 /DNA_ORIENTATION=+